MSCDYDAAGQLAGIRIQVFSGRVPHLSADFMYTVISRNAVPTRLVMTKTDVFGVASFTIQLEHDGTGRYTRRVVSEVAADGERLTSTLSYGIDSHGYLTNRVSEQHYYEPGVAPVSRTEDARCVDWSTSADAAVTSEGTCANSAIYYAIAYPAAAMPSAPLTVFPAYSAFSALDLLCVIADECVDPGQAHPQPY